MNPINTGVPRTNSAQSQNLWLDLNMISYSSCGAGQVIGVPLAVVKAAQAIMLKNSALCLESIIKSEENEEVIECLKQKIVILNSESKHALGLSVLALMGTIPVIGGVIGRKIGDHIAGETYTGNALLDTIDPPDYVVSTRHN